jgi:hypothetical protein
VSRAAKGACVPTKGVLCRTTSKLLSWLDANTVCDTSHRSLFEGFWDATSLKIRTALVQRAAWADTARRIAWKVEVEAGRSVGSRKAPEEEAGAEPWVVMEWILGPRGLPGSKASDTSELADSSSVVFRCDREGLVRLDEALEAAERASLSIAGHT